MTSKKRLSWEAVLPSYENVANNHNISNWESEMFWLSSGTNWLFVSYGRGWCVSWFDCP